MESIYANGKDEHVAPNSGHNAGDSTVCKPIEVEHTMRTGRNGENGWLGLNIIGVVEVNRSPLQRGVGRHGKVLRIRRGPPNDR